MMSFHVTHCIPTFSFDPPRKQKSLVFYVFRGDQREALRGSGLIMSLGFI